MLTLPAGKINRGNHGSKRAELERDQKASVNHTGTNFQIAYHRPVGARNATVRDVVRSGSLTHGNLLLTAGSQARGTSSRHEQRQTRPETGRNGGRPADIVPVPRAWKRVTDVSGQPSVLERVQKASVNHTGTHFQARGALLNDNIRATGLGTGEYCG